MRYFDALTSGAFKTTKDGRRLFFPWGVFGRGYFLASEHDYERVQRQIKAFMIVAFILIVGTMTLQLHIGAAVTILLMLGYAVWALYVVRGLQPSDERMSLEESMTSQALTHNAGFLWAAAIGSFLFVAVGILMLIFEPDQWLVALASIIFFGLCAASITRMLVLRHRRVVR